MKLFIALMKCFISLMYNHKYNRYSSEVLTLAFRYNSFIFYRLRKQATHFMIHITGTLVLCEDFEFNSEMIKNTRRRKLLQHNILDSRQQKKYCLFSSAIDLVDLTSKSLNIT